MLDELFQEYENQIGSPYTDPLTGLYTHGMFRILLDLHTKQAKRKASVFSLALVDVDQFSLYNQNHGTLASDKALKQVSLLIRECIRESDVAARYSGDVFSLIFDGSKSDSAMIAAERIRTVIERAFGSEFTVSIGLASFPSDAENSLDLLAKAYEALGEAKLKGKNRIHFFEVSQERVSEEIPNVLVVDDGQTNRILLAAQLRPLGYNVISAASGQEALSIVKKHKINLILLDVMMPGMDGYEVCRRLKKSSVTRLIPIIMITALDDSESKVKGIEAGADDFLTKPPMREELIARTQSLLKVNMLNQRLTNFENVLYSLANAVEAKDPYTQGHSKRVANMAEAIGREMGLESALVQELKTGGLLHDVGKIGVSEKVLNKPGPLSDEERIEIEKHTLLGYTICLPLKQNLGSSLEVIRHHHEKLDGTGYPDHLKDEEIELPSRILAVSDIYDALTTSRPYRKAFSTESAFQIIDSEVQKGAIDGQVVSVLKRILGFGGAS